MITEPRVVAEDSIAEAWQNAYRLLTEEGNRFNLILHVRNPVGIDASQLQHLDPKNIDAGVDSLRDVATTIFPKKSAKWKLPVKNFSLYYQNIYEVMLRRGRKSWGCYFLRLISFGSKQIDQLDCVTTGLNGWGRNHKAAFTVHFSSAETERPKKLGAPCLHYVEFLVNGEGKLCMTAVYRSHDYFKKALGNLVGLSRLLEFVGMYTGHEIGTLTCVSTYAFIDVSAHKANSLLKKIV